MRILILLFLFAIYFPFSLSQPCKYKIIAQVSNPEVSPGDSVQVNIFVTGGGSGIDSAKIYVSIPVFLRSLEDNMIILSLPIASHGGRNDFLYPPSTHYYKGIFAYILTPELFSHPDSLDPEIMGEGEIYTRNNLIYSPVSFKFKLAKNAPAGEHKITLALYYEKNGMHDVDIAELRIKVMSFEQKYQAIFQIGLIILGGIVGVYLEKKTKYRKYIITFLLLLIFLIIWRIYF